MGMCVTRIIILYQRLSGGKEKIELQGQELNRDANEQGQQVSLPNQMLGDVNGLVLTVSQSRMLSSSVTTRMSANVPRLILPFQTLWAMQQQIRLSLHILHHNFTGARSGPTESGSRRGKRGAAGSLTGPQLVPQSSSWNVRRRVHTDQRFLNAMKNQTTNHPYDNNGEGSSTVHT